MMEPITTMIVSAAAAGVVAATKSTAEKAVKDAYDAFKRIIVERYSDYPTLLDSFDFLIKKPESDNVQKEFAEDLKKAGATEDQTLIQAAEVVNNEVKRCEPEAYESVGLRIGTVEAQNVRIGSVVSSGKGIDTEVEAFKVEGDFEIGDIGRTSNPN